MNLTDWIGRTETVADVVTPTPCAALAAMLDLPSERPPAGTPLPPLWHWLYFLPLYRQSEVGGRPRQARRIPASRRAAAAHVGRSAGGAVKLWARDHEGCLAMEPTAILREP